MSDHAHSEGGGHGHGDHGFAHVIPLNLLFGVLGALLVLTVLTVSVTSIDLGAQGNLTIAMLIATVKAGLVVMYFMHLRWDRLFHLILFLTSVLFLILFLSMSITDRSEYDKDLEAFRQAQAQAK
jgi:cytochrome c oxidase subunit 4